jgi:hypothetical protein
VPRREWRAGLRFDLERAGGAARLAPLELADGLDGGQAPPRAVIVRKEELTTPPAEPRCSSEPSPGSRRQSETPTPLPDVKAPK